MSNTEHQISGYTNAQCGLIKFCLKVEFCVIYRQVLDYIASGSDEMLWLGECNQYNHTVKPGECFESIGLGNSDLNSIFTLEVCVLYRQAQHFSAFGFAYNTNEQHCIVLNVMMNETDKAIFM